MNKIILDLETKRFVDTGIPIGRPVETRKKISDALKGSKHTLGHHHSAETKARMSLAHRKYQYDESIFRNINTNEKAYWLGFIAADGCIHSGNQAGLFIGLASKDRFLLESFKEFIQTNKPIYSYPGKVMLTLPGSIIASNLASYGIIVGREKHFLMPSINPKFYSQFIRGYSDGDGSIGCSHRSLRLRWLLTGHIDFLKQVAEIISNEIGVSYTFLHRNNGQSAVTYNLVYRGTNKVLEVLNWLYKDASMFLPRKIQPILKLEERARFHEVKLKLRKFKEEVTKCKNQGEH